MFKMKKRTLTIIICFLLVLLCVGQAYARSGNLVIEPSRKAVETVNLTVSSSVTGNISADRMVDFYVNSPSGAVIFNTNKTTFATFSFTANENGNYTINVINSNQETTIAILNYSIKHNVVLQGNVNLNFNVASTVIPATAITIDWVTMILTLSGIGSIVGLLLKILKGIRKFVKWLRWLKKYRKSRTPVVIR